MRVVEGVESVAKRGPKYLLFSFGRDGRAVVDRESALGVFVALRMVLPVILLSFKKGLSELRAGVGRESAFSMFVALRRG